MKGICLNIIFVGILSISGCASTLKDSASKGDLLEVNELISSGKDVNAKDDEGWTPIYYALKNDHPSVVEALIAAGADLNLRDVYGQTPLSLAVVYSSLPVTELLIAAGADMDTADTIGRTPLHNAAIKGRPEMVTLLVWCGADVNLRNQVGWTPLDVAVRHDRTEVIGPLLSGGAIGYSYEVRQRFLEAEREEILSEVPVSELDSVLKNDYDSFNQQTTLSLTYTIETLQGELPYREYRSILNGFSDTPEQFYQAGKLGWLIGPWQSVSLSTNGEIYPETRLACTIQSIGFYFFSNSPAQIKIGNEIKESIRIETSSSAEEELVTTGGVFLLTRQLVTQIRSASVITIRIRFENKPSLTWEVPARVLRDWKKFFDEADKLFL